MLSYYGLMRGADVMKIQKKDVNFNKRENCWEVTFNYVRKRVNPGFSYLIPMMYNDYMDKYYSQVIDIPEDKWKNPLNPPRFIRNWNMKGKKGPRMLALATFRNSLVRLQKCLVWTRSNTQTTPGVAPLRLISLTLV